MVGVSSLSPALALRAAMARMQRDLAGAQTEVSTGRAADLGLALGAGTSQSVSLNRDFDRIKGIIDTNGLASARLSTSQAALKQLGASADTFLSTLTIGQGSGSAGASVEAGAQGMLSSLTALMNTAINGEYVFGGTNTDAAPIEDGGAQGSAARQAFKSAFQSRFGFGVDDPAAANISKADMNSFLDSVSDQFLGSGWSANWSSATDGGTTARIALNETMQTSFSANDEGVRKLAFASASVSFLFSGKLGDAAKQAVIGRAISLTGEATGNVAQFEGRIGIAEKRLSDANDRLSAQADTLESRIGKLEGVDPYEASTRVTSLMQQIETSYALTARLNQLSLASYLS